MTYNKGSYASHRAEPKFADKFTNDGHIPIFQGWSANDNPIWECSNCKVKMWEGTRGYTLHVSTYIIGSEDIDKITCKEVLMHSTLT